ncbi:MAG: sigma-54 dependent transcriptional regulator [bacterium]
MKEDLNIVIVDDDDYIRLSLKVLLDPFYKKITCLSSAEEIPEHLGRQGADVMLLDMNFSAGETSCREGIHWLKRVRELSPDTNVILITAYSDITVAVDAIKLGAIDFIVKPWENGKILATVHAAATLSKSQKTVSFLKDRQQALGSSSDLIQGEMIGESPAMKKIFETIGKAAPTDANILILGENGTGKELIARAIHRGSLRAGELFVTVDLSSIAETLFESELFGHVRGAFTDAKENRIGRFEAASGGTLFLDEIGNLSLAMQAKLLAVLQNRTLTRVGSNKTTGIDVRLVCATNKPLNQMVLENSFRQDLLYRINTVQIDLPPLRKRTDDIPLLIRHFMEIYGRKYNKTHLKVGNNLLERVMKYPWPGNVRELQHAVERALILCTGNSLSNEDFSFTMDMPPDLPVLEIFDLDHLEKKTIIDCLKKHNGNISKAAPELGLTRGALYRRLEKYGL